MIGQRTGASRTVNPHWQLRSEKLNVEQIVDTLLLDTGDTCHGDRAGYKNESHTREFYHIQVYNHAVLYCAFYSTLRDTDDVHMIKETDKYWYTLASAIYQSKLLQ